MKRNWGTVVTRTELPGEREWEKKRVTSPDWLGSTVADHKQADFGMKFYSCHGATGPTATFQGYVLITGQTLRKMKQASPSHSLRLYGQDPHSVPPSQQLPCSPQMPFSDIITQAKRSAGSTEDRVEESLTWKHWNF